MAVSSVRTGLLVRLLAGALLALAVGCAESADNRGVVPPLHPSVDGYPEAEVVVSQDGTDHRLVVKVADTRERQRHGLMEVPELPEGTGMLFVFPGQQRGGFWMRGTLVPLSIAFADADGRILEVLRMEPCPTPPPEGCPRYTPETPYRTALEVPAGFFEERGIGPGARLRVQRLPLGKT